MILSLQFVSSDRWKYIANFLCPSSKNKKIHPEKIFYTPGKWNFLTLILKDFLYFLKKNLFLYFKKWKTPKEIPYTFSKESFSYISESGNPKKDFLYFRKQNFLIFQETSYISGSNFPSPKNKKTHSEKMS